MEGRDDTSILDDEADADSDNDVAPFQVPEGLRVVVDSPKELVLTEQKQNPKTDKFVGKKIMYTVSVQSSWTGITYLFYSFPIFSVTYTLISYNSLFLHFMLKVQQCALRSACATVCNHFCTVGKSVSVSPVLRNLMIEAAGGRS